MCVRAEKKQMYFLLFILAFFLPSFYHNIPPQCHSVNSSVDLYSAVVIFSTFYFFIVCFFSLRSFHCYLYDCLHVVSLSSSDRPTIAQRNLNNNKNQQNEIKRMHRIKQSDLLSCMCSRINIAVICLTFFSQLFLPLPSVQYVC